MPAPAHPSDCIFGVVGGHVVSVELATGEEQWRTKIPGGSTSSVASVVVRDGLVVVGSRGVLHCFDGQTGARLWSNELKGLGYGNIFLGSPGDAQAAAVVQQAAAAAQIAASS